MPNRGKQRKVGIAWSLNSRSGWGVYGHQIVKHMALSGRFHPVLLEERDSGSSDPLEKAFIESAVTDLAEAHPGLLDTCRRDNRRLAMPLLYALGERARPAFLTAAAGIFGNTNHALTFFERGSVTEEERTIYNRFDSVTAGSTWNGDLLRESGVRNVQVCLQGVDPSRFHPAPKRNLFRDRFVIFSGGKMEFRKGQDIVLRAFSEFVRRHDEALLINVWGNRWGTGFGYGMFEHSPYIDSPPPARDDGKVDIVPWFGSFGLDADHVMAFNHYPHDQTALLMREADVAIFPNRCEGGTNLVAMEAMACGVPTILSANTGHLDIIADHACLPLRQQNPVKISNTEYDVTGWGESSIDEILAHLEFVYSNSGKAKQIGAAGVKHMQSFSSDSQILKLLEGLEEHGL